MSELREQTSAYAAFEEDHRRFGAPDRRYSATLRVSALIAGGLLLIALSAIAFL